MTNGIGIHKLKRLLPLLSVLMLSALGVVFATQGRFALAMPISENPAGPLILLLRVALLALSIWVGGLTLVAVIARMLGLTKMATRVCGLLPRAVGSIVRRSIGVGLIGSMLLTSPAVAVERHKPVEVVAASQDSPYSAHSENSGDVANGQRWPATFNNEPIVVDPDAPTLVALTGRPAPSTTLTTTIPAPKGALSIPQSPVVPSTPQSSVSPTTKPTTTKAQNAKSSAGISTTQTPPAVPGVASPVGETYRVVPGDHFWGIARRTVTRKHPNATETMIGMYCHTLIQHNRSRLHDPHNPDLLHVGVQLVLPPVS